MILVVVCKYFFLRSLYLSQYVASYFIFFYVDNNSLIKCFRCYSGMGILRIFPHLRIFLGSQCMTLNGHISIKR